MPTGTEITPEHARRWLLFIALTAGVLAFIFFLYGVIVWKTSPNHNLQINAQKDLVCLDGLEYFTVKSVVLSGSNAITFVTGVKYDSKTMQPETCSR
jgi:hypothetical protein